MTRSMLYVSSLLFFLSVITAAVVNPRSRHLELVNESGEKLAVDWVHPQTGQTVPFGAPTNGEHFEFDSFVNHTFVIRSSNATEEAYVTVSEDPPSQLVIVKQGLQVQVLDPNDAKKHDLQASEVVRECRIQAELELKAGKDATKVTADLVSCLEQETADILLQAHEQISFQADLRQQVSRLAENYTCADPTRKTSEPVEVRQWTHDGKTRNVRVLHNRPSSQIHLLENFISPEECQAIQDAAAPSLHRGTVADGKGGSRMSENRKAWQAGVKVTDWDGDEVDDPEKNPILAVKQRLFDYTNEVTGYNMLLPGQEDLMSIQYFGNGKNDSTPDRYTPHCDGDCDGMPHKTGGRVATMVMYCDVPELGGGTNFQHSNVFVQPQVGAAAFFSYLDPVTHLHEQGFTTHSGCPVLEGTKRIAVQWMRIGVGAENPWDSFDTNNIKKSFYQK